MLSVVSALSLASGLYACPRSDAGSGAPTKLLPTTGTAYDVAGLAVAVSGNIAVIGSPLDDEQGAGSGSATVFRWNGTDWVQESVLLASDGVANDRFGCAVSVDGDRIAVGARYAHANGVASGAVYIFHFNSSIWAPEAKLMAADANAFGEFGAAVSIRGERVLVGARLNDDLGPDSGAGYLFRWTGNSWVQDAKLFGDNTLPHDQFGTAVALADDVALIGAPNSDPAGWSAGAAYVFRRSPSGQTWNQEARLEPASPAPSRQFGNAVAIDGENALIGAWGDDEQGWDAGAAYVFRHSANGWSEIEKLTPFDGSECGLFGCSVSIRGSNALIGSPLAPAADAASGAAYRFRADGTGWTVQEKLTASADSLTYGFGYSVSVDASAFLVGAPFDDDSGTEAGCAYVFTILEPLFADLNGDGSVNQLDLAILLGAWAALGGPADLDGDGWVGQEDLALMLGAWTSV